MKRLLFGGLMACAVFFTQSVEAQEKGWQILPLDQMNQFKEQAGNWFLVSDVTMDRNLAIHHEEAPAQADKKSKKKKKGDEATPSQAVTYKAGTGILLNMNDQTKKGNIVTTWEHGDLELELEVMLPKGSNSGIFLQGRYELQLSDSWQEPSAKFSDLGGIYRNWESTPGQIYMGKAPLVNAAKAPGLWQTLKIAFKAPRFDAAGKKIANAEFTTVELNGVRIHDHVEVPMPTGGPIANNEVAMGPLMIQGDHGPVALRNIRYKKMHENNVTISDLSYKVFKGEFNAPKDFANQKPIKTGQSKELTHEVTGMDDAFAVVYTGTMDMPEDATYTFLMAFNGGAALSVNDKMIIGPGLGRNSGKAELKKGTYPFSLTYYKNVVWDSPRLALFVGNEHTYPKALQAFGSFPPDADVASPILIHVGSEPKILRAFVDFKGDRTRRITHAVGVGEPKGLSYVYDMESGNIACVWRGDFVNATPMWHDRGDGSFKPLGLIQYLYKGPSLAVLPTADAPFPKQSDEKDFRAKGYSLDAVSQRPLFTYLYKGVEVLDQMNPEVEKHIFTRDVRFKNSVPNLYYKIAEGTTAQQMPDGSYALDGNQYYIKVLSAIKPVIRDQNGKKELVIPVDGNPITYSIIW